jgi:hypothetical protein
LVFAWVAVFFEGFSWFLGPSEGMLVFKNSFSRSLRDGAGRRPSEGMLVVSDSIHSQSNRETGLALGLALLHKREV